MGTNPNPQSQIAGRRISIHGARPIPRLRRPIRPYLRPRRRPVLFGVLQKVPVKRRVDVVYPHGVGGNSIVDKLALNGNFDGFLTAAIATYVYNRYIASWAALPSITDLLGTLGIARSLSEDPKVLQIIEKIIGTIEQNVP